MGWVIMGGLFQLFWGWGGVSRNWASAHFLAFSGPVWNCLAPVCDHKDADGFQGACTELMVTGSLLPAWTVMSSGAQSFFKGRAPPRARFSIFKWFVSRTSR